MAEPADTSDIPSQESTDKIKHAGGRPVKWTEKKAMALLEDIWTWLQSPPRVVALTEKCIKLGHNVTLEMFFTEKGLHPTLLSRLCKEYEQFCKGVKEMKEYQSSKISDLALNGELNGRYAQFYQSACHGLVAQTKVEQSGTMKLEGGGGINITYEVVPSAAVPVQKT